MTIKSLFSLPAQPLCKHSSPIYTTSESTRAEAQELKIILPALQLSLFFLVIVWTLLLSILIVKHKRHR